jgi:hypothetical protein
MEVGLAVYQAFDGDSDGFTRTGTAAQKALLPANEWRAIESLLHDLFLVRQGLVSAAYEAGVQRRLAQQCSSEQVRAALRALAQTK